MQFLIKIYGFPGKSMDFLAKSMYSLSQAKSVYFCAKFNGFRCSIDGFSMEALAKSIDVLEINQI